MGKQCAVMKTDRDTPRRAAMALARALARAMRATATTTTTTTAAAGGWSGARARAMTRTTDATPATDGDDGARDALARATRDARRRRRATTRATATMAPTASTAPGATLEDGGLGSRVMEMWLMAVPKRKVTPSRRKRRNQFKRLPFVESVVRCGVCGKVNLPHVRCCDVGARGAEGRGARGDAGDVAVTRGRRRLDARPG